ncbi:MAG: aminotransferase class III-fold pyridoxal phosphate-dependent enzyme, partial [Rikenellaceae bacterium]
MKPFEVYSIYDINIVRAEGSYVYDDKGTQYLDMYGGHAVVSVGHGNKRYCEAITDQLSKIGFYSNSVIIEQQKALAQRLGELSDKKDYALFMCNSGAEANENALKLASFHTSRSKVICFSGAFHGRTSLAVAITDNAKIVAPINQTDNIVRLPFNDVEALVAEFDSQG